MDEERAFAVHPHLAVRLAVGLVQGIALYLLLEAERHHLFPTTQQMALVFVFAFVPILFLQGLGTVRLSRLLVWCAVAAAVAAGLGYYAAWRDTGAQFSGGRFAAGLFLAPGLFIAHALVLGGDADRRFMATYPTHFDVAWKLALQLVLVAMFEIAFWLLLLLGAVLFNMIGLSFLRELIGHDWFIYPATALVVAGGFHLTDMQPAIVRGMRNLVLVLFSWLLPLMTLLAAGFLCALPFTGLEPLWRTGHASGELLGATAVLVILINAMFQDGRGEHPAVLRYAGIIAAVALVPLAELAGYALVLRVQQYGWTTDRVATAATVLVAGFYAIGYAVSGGAAWRSAEADRALEFRRLSFGIGGVAVPVLAHRRSGPHRGEQPGGAAAIGRGQCGEIRFQLSAVQRPALRPGGAGQAGPLRQCRDRPPCPRGAGRHFCTALGSRPQIEPAMLGAIAVYPKGKSLPVPFAAQKWTRGQWRLSDRQLRPADQSQSGDSGRHGDAGGQTGVRGGGGRFRWRRQGRCIADFAVFENRQYGVFQRRTVPRRRSRRLAQRRRLWNIPIAKAIWKPCGPAR